MKRNVAICVVTVLLALWCQQSLDMQHPDNCNGKTVKAIQALLQFILVSSSFGTSDCESGMWPRWKEREWEKSPGLLKCEYSLEWKPLPSQCKHMLFEFIALPVLSPAAPTFSLWQICHACYFTENTIWYRRSPSSFHLSIGKDQGWRGKCKAKWKWQAGERSNSLWHEALKTPHLHYNTACMEWIVAQSQRKPTNNVPQQLWAHSNTITSIILEITL